VDRPAVAAVSASDSRAGLKQIDLGDCRIEVGLHSAAQDVQQIGLAWLNGRQTN
jgi:hypothetical protein